MSQVILDYSWLAKRTAGCRMKRSFSAGWMP